MGRIEWDGIHVAYLSIYLKIINNNYDIQVSTGVYILQNNAGGNEK